MATLRPFRAVRPADSDTAQEVAALPYDVMTSMEARKMTVGRPNSFLHIDRAEIDLPTTIDVYSDEVYLKARDNFNKMFAEGIFIQDKEPCFYIYREIMDGRAQYGIVACASIDEYINGTIKRHELTLEEKEIDRMKHVYVVDANTGPIFLTYRKRDKIDQFVSEWVEFHSPVYDFMSSDDGITHTVWVVDNQEAVSTIVKAFEQVPNLYIADGHHRNASAVRVGLRKREENPSYSPDAEFNYYLSVIFPSDQLKIYDYNRVVKDLNGFKEQEFFGRLTDFFDIERYMGEKYPGPTEPHTFGMYIGKNWYTLRTHQNLINENDCIERLDVTIMQEYILSLILDIKDPRTDKRIDFVGGIRGLGELVKRVNKDAAVAFAMYPTSIEELLAVADQDKIMPPKSTWFEPKLRSGLFVHLLK
ncbi:MAG: DUF1015 family protein [Clostridiales bacterium]|jgi:uncharacterized protein (DUF1015 family)|nr:DUF1015 family protein [Clostridiales bacterium]